MIAKQERMKHKFVTLDSKTDEEINIINKNVEDKMQF